MSSTNNPASRSRSRSPLWPGAPPPPRGGGGGGADPGGGGGPPPPAPLYCEASRAAIAAACECTRVSHGGARRGAGGAGWQRTPSSPRGGWVLTCGLCGLVCAALGARRARRRARFRLDGLERSVAVRVRVCFCVRTCVGSLCAARFVPLAFAVHLAQPRAQRCGARNAEATRRFRVGVGVPRNRSERATQQIDNFRDFHAVTFHCSLSRLATGWGLVGAKSPS